MQTIKDAFGSQINAVQVEYEKLGAKVEELRKRAGELAEVELVSESPEAKAALRELIGLVTHTKHGVTTTGFDSFAFDQAGRAIGKTAVWQQMRIRGAEEQLQKARDEARAHEQRVAAYQEAQAEEQWQRELREAGDPKALAAWEKERTLTGGKR